MIYGEYVKRSALFGSRYNQFKSWAKTVYTHLSEDDLNNFCRKINQASSVFKNWELIVENCTDWTCRWIDVREFSIDRLYRCRRRSFVVDLNSANRPEGGMPDIEERLYSEESYQRLKRKIIHDGILQEIEFNPQTSSAICERLQRELTSYCQCRDDDQFEYLYMIRSNSNNM